MDTSRNIQILEGSLDRILRWITAADTKISPILIIDTTLLGVLAALGSKIQYWSVQLSVAPSVAALLVMMSLLFLSLCWFPRTRAVNDSLIYFGTIARLTEEGFGEAIEKRTQETYLEDLVAQCHVNAVIAATKFKWIRRAQLCLYSSLIFWLVAVWQLS